MDWPVIAACSGVALAIISGLIVLYSRVSVAEARIQDARDDVKSNYDYCHKANHEINGSLMNHHARLRVAETALRIKSDPRDE